MGESAVIKWSRDPNWLYSRLALNIKQSEKYITQYLYVHICGYDLILVYIFDDDQ